MNSLTLAITWLLIIEIFSFSTFPLISIFFRGLEDRGFALSKILAILISTYIMWILGSFHIVQFNSTSSLIISLSVILISTLFMFSIILNKENKEHKNKLLLIISKITNNKIFNKYNINNRSLPNNKNLRNIILIEEIIFILSFLAWIYIRGINPDAMGTEKFMDYGIMNSLLKSQYFPPNDMWLSGFKLNYYYYGQYIYSFLTSLSRIPSNYTYNFSIATIFAFTFTFSFSLVHSISKRIYSAIISASVLSIAGNLDYGIKQISYYINKANNAVLTFWYPSSTRMIPNTINEFPIYSFIVADLHAHVANMPIVIVSLLLSANIFNKGTYRLWDYILYSFVLGIIAITNTWDAIIYSLILLGTLIYVYSDGESYDKKYKGILNIFNFPLIKALLDTFLTGISALVIFIPFYLSFKAPVDGIGINNISHSDPLIILTLFGFFAFFIISFILFIIYSSIINKKFYSSDLFVLLLIFIGIGLIILPEFIYLKDIFYKANPPYFRANTVFKMYYQAWILLSLTVGYIIARINFIIHDHIYNFLVKIGVFLWDTLAFLLLTGVFLYSIIAINQAYFDLKDYNSLDNNSKTRTCFNKSICFNSFKTDDGTAYLETQHLDDSRIIKWLNENATGNSVILEAVGDSYQYNGRISINTGLSTVLGWPNHEYQWRNTSSYSDERKQDIQNIYTTTDQKVFSNLINKYNITYIVVGDTEKQIYPNINEELIKASGESIFTSGNTYLIKIIKQ